MIERITDKCNGFGNCELACRKNIILLKERDGVKKIAYFTAPGECVVCYVCHAQCPVEGAIYVNPGKTPEAFRKRVPAFIRLAMESD